MDYVARLPDRHRYPVALAPCHETNLPLSRPRHDGVWTLTFYTAAWGLEVGRRFDEDFVELIGGDAPIYLLGKAAGTAIGPAGGDARRYERHWTPVHPDFAVEDLDSAIARAVAAGAVQEGETCEAPYGRLAMFADPFGHGFCLIEFSEKGYDALLA